MSRDVTWLNETYSEYYKIQGIKIENDCENYEEEEKIEVGDVEPGVPGAPKPKSRLMGELKRLSASYNPEATQQLESISAAMEPAYEYGFVEAVTIGYNEPSNFDEAWNNKNSEDKVGWREAIKKEFDDMERQRKYRASLEGYDRK